MVLNNNDSDNSNPTLGQIVELRKKVYKARKGRSASFQRLTKAVRKAEDLPKPKNTFDDNITKNVI
jgi:hypothetical protein